MNKHCKKANELFLKGYNCSQSVVGAYADELGIDFETLIKLSSSFGGGMGKLREVCGAVSGMFIVAGILKGYSTPNNDKIKCNHYALIQKLGHSFKDKFGSIICRELLNLDTQESPPTPTKRTVSFYKDRPCGKFIQTACDILDEEIFQE
ncbi:MAG: C-GCAxxG-C-C family protein [Candidatus Gastranaerophilaceae bacterium]